MLLCFLFHASIPLPRAYVSCLVVPLSRAIMFSGILVFPAGVLSVSLPLSNLVIFLFGEEALGKLPLS